MYQKYGNFFGNFNGAEFYGTLKFLSGTQLFTTVVFGKTGRRIKKPCPFYPDFFFIIIFFIIPGRTCPEIGGGPGGADLWSKSWGRLWTLVALKKHEQVVNNCQKKFSL